MSLLRTQTCSELIEGDEHFRKDALSTQTFILSTSGSIPYQHRGNRSAQRGFDSEHFWPQKPDVLTMFGVTSTSMLGAKG
jgi:hypothetical protein